MTGREAHGTGRAPFPASPIVGFAFSDLGWKQGESVMALEFQPRSDEYGHTCRLPWPRDPEIPEGHSCECGRQWVYQPARWEPLLTLQELEVQQQAGDFLQGIVPRFRPAAALKSRDDGAILSLPDRAPAPQSDAAARPPEKPPAF